MTPPQTQSNEFARYWARDYNDSLVEITAAVKSFPVNREHQDLNYTKWVAGGGVVTENHRPGMVQSKFSIDCVFDPDLYALCQRILAKPTGTEIRAVFGNNAEPQGGDPMFRGTFTLFGVNITYNVGSEASMSLDFAPTDAGTYAPAWTTY